MCHRIFGCVLARMMMELFSKWHGISFLNCQHVIAVSKLQIVICTCTVKSAVRYIAMQHLGKGCGIVYCCFHVYLLAERSETKRAKHMSEDL